MFCISRQFELKIVLAISKILKQTIFRQLLQDVELN